MNKRFTQIQILVLISLIFAFKANAQVGIGTNQPDPSAQLEVLSNSKGLLIPRMSDIQRKSISSPANGLLVYQTNNGPGFYFYNNGNWQKLASTLDTDSGKSGGNSLLSGDSNPVGSLGNEGDFYLNTLTKTLVGPKQHGLWPLGGIKLEAVENSTELSLSLDANQNLSIKNGNSVSLSDLYQNLSLAGTVLSLSGPRQSHVDLAALLGNGIGESGRRVVSRDLTLKGNGTTEDPLGIAPQGISADRLKNITTNGLGGQVLTSDGSGGFAWSKVSSDSSRVVDATKDLKGVIRLAGDLEGTANAPIVRDGAISTNKIADGAITSDKIAAAAITSDKVSNAAITNDKIAGPIDAAKIGGVSQDVKDYVDGQLASGGTGGTGKLVEAQETILGGIQLAGDLEGTAKAPLVRSGVITTIKIADGNVTNDKISSLDGSKITGTIAVDKISGLDASKVNGLGVLLDGKEDLTNKIQAITAASPSNEKYPSEDAVVKYVADVAATIVAGGGVAATSAALGTIQLAGDLDGLATAPVVRSGAISTGKLATNAVTTDKIADANVTHDKLAANSVTENKLADNAVTGNKIADHSVTTDKLADASVTNAKIIGPVSALKIAGINQETQDEIADVKGAITALGTSVNANLASKENAANKSNDPLGNSTTLFPTQQAVKTYVDAQVGGGQTPEATTSTLGTIQLAGDLTAGADGAKTPIIKSNAIDAGKLAADAVITAKILDKNVTSQKLADGAVTSLQLGKDAVTNDKIANGAIDGNKIADGTITEKQIASGTITSDKIAGLDASKVTGLTASLAAKQDVANLKTDINLSGTNAEYPSVLAVKTYVDTKVGSGGAPATAAALGTIQLAGDLAGSATVPEIKADAITATKLASDAVETIKIKDQAVTSSKLADGAITNAKIATGIDGGKITDGSITSDKIAGPIDASKIDGVSQDVSDALALKEDAANKSTDNTKLDFMSNEKFPTELVVKAFVGAEILKAQIAAGGGTGPASTSELGTIVLAGDLMGDPYAPTVKGLADKEPKFDVLTVAKGGTGIASYTPGSFIKAQTATQLIEVSAASVKADLGLDKVENLSGTDIDGKINSAVAGKFIEVGQKGANDGVATLGANGKIPSSQLPNFESGSVDVVADEAAMLALSTNDLKLGSLAIVTGESKTYVLAGGDGSSKSHWVEIVSPGSVRTVNGKTGDVVLTKADFPEIANLDNTSDADKPISDATQTALDSKQDIANISQNIASETNPTSKYPSVKAVSDYVATAVQSATNTPDASTTVKGIVRLAADLGGSADAPQVISVNGMAASAVSSGAKLANDATVTKTANTLVKRDGAGNIIGDILGNATTATSITGLVDVQHGGTGLPSVAAGSFLIGDNTTSLTTKTLAQVKTDLGLNNAELTTNKSQSVTTDAASTTKYPSVKAVKDYVDGKTSIGSADKLTTPRKINEVEFDGTKDITIPFKLTGVAAGNYTNANINVDANGVITLIENGTGGSTLTPATKTDLGGVVVGDGIDVDGTTGKISTKTDLAYNSTTTQGEITSSTGLTATIPGADASRAGLMSSIDKSKLDKIPEPKVADANKVLTVNSSGTATEWKDAAPASGGGGMLTTYNPGGNKSFFVRATGPGVTVSLSGSTVTVNIPANVHLDYLKVSTTLSAVSNASLLDFEVIDQGKKWNNNYDDLILPVINFGVRNTITPIQDIVYSPGTTLMPVMVKGYADGILKFAVSTNGNGSNTNGFYIALRF